MWGALTSEDNKVCMFRRKNGISITFEEGQLTDEQAEELFWIAYLMNKTGNRMKDLWKLEGFTCNTSEKKSNT